MINIIIKMYLTLTPPIIAGILNMIWCKLPIFECINKPIDFNKNFLDNKRILGNNKTWKGLVGYLVLNIICFVIWGTICNILHINDMNYFYQNNDNTILFNIMVGLLLGFGYSIFELPNSFIKRRFGIKEGKSIKGIKKILFIFIDQADSVFGCCLVVWLFYDLGIKMYLLYVLLGSLTHLLFNIILYFMKLRKNMF